MNTHRLVLNAGVVRIYTNGKLTTLGYNADKITEIRDFIRGSGLSDAEIDEKMKELSVNGETEILDKV